MYLATLYVYISLVPGSPLPPTKNKYYLSSLSPFIFSLHTSQSPSTPHSCTPTSSILTGPRLPRPLPYGMKPIQLTWQKEVTYDEQGNILDMVKLDPTKFPSHRYMHREFGYLLPAILRQLIQGGAK